MSFRFLDLEVESARFDLKKSLWESALFDFFIFIFPLLVPSLSSPCA